ncbi:MAG: hypothetical protein HYU36_12965 [Planctomycetes bacterium]|nr:hypothetical protein [Planctomycetota bacterium]
MTVSKEVLTSSNLEIFFNGTAQDTANITVKKWFDEQQFVEERFYVLIGDTIGESKVVKLPWEQNRKRVDFNTGNILVDIITDVRKVQVAPTEKIVFNPDMSIKRRDEDNKPVTRTVNIEIVKDTSKIVVVDAKGRTLEFEKYEKEDSPRAPAKSTGIGGGDSGGVKPKEESSEESKGGGKTKTTTGTSSGKVKMPKMKQPKGGGGPK